MMSSDFSPDRFPIHFVAHSGYMYFAEWNWNDYFISKELLTLDIVSSGKFIEQSDKETEFSVQKDFFETNNQYLYFILLRLLLGSDHANIYSLEQSVEIVHISLLNPTDYKNSSIIKELDEPIGNWKKFDLISYRKIKESLELLKIGKTIKKAIFDLGERKEEAIVFEMFYDDEILGYFIIKEITKDDFE